MDKNKVVIIAVGAGIVGLFVGWVISSFHDGGRGDRGYDMKNHDEKGVMMNNRREYGDDTGKGEIIGIDHSKMNHGAMDSMMVDSEREFITAMIPHHEEAITSAKDVLARGTTTPQIKTLAQNIVKAQEAEVAQMKSWYKNWYGTDYKANGNYKPMMRDVSTLEGKELDKTFLTDMIAHHQMALMMANSVDAHIEHDEVKTLSRSIKTTQTAEIETIKNLLKTLN